MKIIRQFFNVLKESFASFWRNKTMSFTSVISIAAMLTLFGIVMLMILNLNGIVYQTGEKLDKVVFFLKDEADSKEVNAFISELNKNDKVKKVSYVSREEALDKSSNRADLEINIKNIELERKSKAGEADEADEIKLKDIR